MYQKLNELDWFDCTMNLIEDMKNYNQKLNELDWLNCPMNWIDDD